MLRVYVDLYYFLHRTSLVKMSTIEAFKLYIFTIQIEYYFKDLRYLKYCVFSSPLIFYFFLVDASDCFVK